MDDFFPSGECSFFVKQRLLSALGKKTRTCRRLQTKRFLTEWRKCESVNFVIKKKKKKMKKISVLKLFKAKRRQWAVYVPVRIWDGWAFAVLLHLGMAKHDSVQMFDTSYIFQATKTARHLFYIKKWNKISHFFLLLLFSFQLALFLSDCCSQNADVVKVCALHCLVLIESIQFEPFVSFDFYHLCLI